MVKNLPEMRETWVQPLGREGPLEKEMATHSSVLVWRIPWTEEPGGRQSMGSQSRTRLSDFTSSHLGTTSKSSLHTPMARDQSGALQSPSHLSCLFHC